MAALLPDRTIQRLRAVLIGALQNVGVGGDTWTVDRPSGGDGITGPKTTTTVIITGYIAQESPERGVYALAGTNVPEAPYRLIIVSGAVQAGDILTSAADPSIRFQVEQAVGRALYPEAIARPL